MNGEQVGTVSEHGLQKGGLVLHHGLLQGLLHEDIAIPLRLIGQRDEQGLYLTITKDQALKQDGCTRPA